MWLTLTNSTLYIEIVSLSILLISYIDALKPLGVEQFLSNSSYIPSGFNNKLPITAYSVIVSIYMGVVARRSIPLNRLEYFQYC
jgi:hypothetical protein